MIQAIRGTKDLLPENAYLWQFVESAFKTTSELYGYEEMRTPIFERTEVFSRSIGENTDIVNKEMYTFEDRGGDSITLRPEETAAVARAVLQNSMLQQGQILRCWYFGPYFRYERPQKGRLRQFHQYGAECIGTPNPESDVEIILLAKEIAQSIGIREYKLLLNTLGSAESRKAYRSALKEYFSSKINEMSEDSRTRMENNPLRILDSKDERDQKAIKEAPLIVEHLDSESSDHFENVKEQLRSAGVEFELAPRLVRGLDYYSHTVFEMQSAALGAQDSFGGGGRYNHLFEQLGSKKPIPAVGVALGVERMLLVLEKQGNMPEQKPGPDVFMIVSSHQLNDKAVIIAEMLRSRGLKVVSDVQRRSMKAQFRESNKSGAKFVVILGEEEVQKETVQVKNMEDGKQEEIGLAHLKDYKFV